MTKQEAIIDFDKLKSLFPDKKDRKEIKDEDILEIVRDPSRLEKIDEAYRPVFWILVTQRLLESKEFKEKVFEATEEGREQKK